MTDIKLLDTIAIGSARGRKAAPLALEYVRDLTEADLDLVLNPPALGVKTSPLVRLRNTHHALARLLAEGRPQAEAALITGYSPSRISILQHDPAFKELVAYYAAQKEARYLDVHERLAALGMSCLEELQERLENDPDAMTNKELRELAELCLDRSVTAGAKPGPSGPPSITITFVKPDAKAQTQPGGPIIDIDPA